MSISKEIAEENAKKLCIDLDENDRMERDVKKQEAKHKEEHPYA